MRDALEATGRPIVHNICEGDVNRPWEWASDVGHLWRTTHGISDSRGGMLSIARQNLPLDAYAEPGTWNGPGMPEVGNGGMTDTEYRTRSSLVDQDPLGKQSRVISAEDGRCVVVGLMADGRSPCSASRTGPSASRPQRRRRACPVRDLWQHASVADTFSATVPAPGRHVVPERRQRRERLGSVEKDTGVGEAEAGGRSPRAARPRQGARGARLR